MPTRLLSRRLVPGLALALALLGAAVPAGATDYWKLEDLLGDFFKGSPPKTRIAPKYATLTDADAVAIAKKLGIAPAQLKRTWPVYIAEAEGKRLGYAILDQELGLHENIDFGVRFDLKGTVGRVEIIAFREPYGDGVRAERFRQQFVGKTAGDPITAGKDIDIVSGASISSRSVALGVKRDALVLQAALKNGL